MGSLRSRIRVRGGRERREPRHPKVSDAVAEVVLVMVLATTAADSSVVDDEVGS